MSPVKVIPSLSDYPRSHAANYIRTTPITSEQVALKDLKVRSCGRAHKNKPTTAQSEKKKLPGSASALQAFRPKREVLIADLRDFEVYRCPDGNRSRPSELTSLHLFDIKVKNLCFDGHVRLGNVEHYLERIGIEDISVEGYGRTNSPRVAVYLQTRLASRDKTHDIWLRLRKPASNYERFHNPFLWVATFAKLSIDYMDDQPRASVSLESFRNDFHAWVVRQFGHNEKFKKWSAAFRNGSDFRVALHAYVDYIYNQAVNLSTARHLVSHPIWSHCKCAKMVAVERQPNVVRDTLATPHVFRSFKPMYFGSKLKEVSPVKPVSLMQAKRKRALGFAEDDITQSLPRDLTNNLINRSRVRVGDLVSIKPDDADKIKWQKSGNEWLAYVQAIETLNDGRQRLMVLWLYRPADTNICVAKYPFAKELFLSDNCNCGDPELLSTDVLRIHSVDWSPQSLNTTKEFFIRQTYITQDSAFVTLKNEHTVCACHKPKTRTREWSAGDTVYISKTTDRQQQLEPMVIHQIDYDQNEVKVRTLLRLARDCSKLALDVNRTQLAPNELVLTGKLKTLPILRIKRACHVRFVPQIDVLNHRIPSPYNKGGAGDYWFISMGLDSTDNSQRLVFLDKLPKGFRDAQEVPLPCKKLRGLSLFSGGGGLDRGLEEGGAVEFQTSVDYDSAAIHTQRANCHDPQKMRLFCGSVDDYIHSLVSGDRDRLIARVGEVDLIAAGSPCPGFSALQQNMLSQQSLTYASHVTTFCTAVDMHRPLYGILENVVNMASTRTGLEEQNVLSQLVACLVSMGYQVNQFIMDSWTYSSFQQRSRIALTIAAPGLEPILQPPHTHSRPYEETAARSLGKLPNGERFGDREHYATPFPIVSAHQATYDLPDIGNGNVQTCIPFPDHRLSRPTNSKDRALLECIPRQPPGCGYAQAMQRNLVPPCLQLNKAKPDKAYRRIKADGLVPTITTTVNMQDGHNGASVHWSQHRPLSLQEIRRAQGYPDNEPVIGTLCEQWRIIGNGVDRKVAFSLGLALRDALTQSKRMSWTSEALEDEAELVVDAEEELEEHLSEVSQRTMAEVSREISPVTSVSSSTDSFSSIRETRDSFDLSMSLDGAQNFEPPLSSPPLTSLQQPNEAQQPLVPTEGFFSHLSRKVSANVGRLSLPVLPAFLPSTQPIFSTKRRHDDDGDGIRGASNTVETQAVPCKRAKFVEVRRTTSPTRTRQASEVKREDRRASLPPLTGATHTRRSGPAEFAPKAWHKKIGASNNVVQLP